MFDIAILAYSNLILDLGQKSCALKWLSSILNWPRMKSGSTVLRCGIHCIQVFVFSSTFLQSRFSRTFFPVTCCVWLSSLLIENLILPWCPHWRIHISQDPAISLVKAIWTFQPLISIFGYFQSSLIDIKIVYRKQIEVTDGI